MVWFFAKIENFQTKNGFELWKIFKDLNTDKSEFPRVIGLFIF